MRDSKLAQIATQLAATATEIEKSLGCSIGLRAELLRRTRAKQLHAQLEVHAEILGMAGRGYREHQERELAHRLVSEAMKNIDFEVETLHEHHLMGNFVRFIASAYVLTQADVTALVDEAIAIGRRS